MSIRSKHLSCCDGLEGGKPRKLNPKGASRLHSPVHRQDSGTLSPPPPQSLQNSTSKIYPGNTRIPNPPYIPQLRAAQHHNGSQCTEKVLSTLHFPTKPKPASTSSPPRPTLTTYPQPHQAPRRPKQHNLVPQHHPLRPPDPHRARLDPRPHPRRHRRAARIALHGRQHIARPRAAER